MDLGLWALAWHKGDLKIVSQMLRNLEAEQGKVEFQAPLVGKSADL